MTTYPEPSLHSTFDPSSVMRLLSTIDFKVKEFLTDIPRYAILSHTWEQEEVTFQDIQNLDVAKSKAGFRKVLGACARARRYHFEWIWIDSCCINKESSAELSEALNSMYQYYEGAGVCYVYLSDVSGEYHPRKIKSNFRDSRWFKRGWTLQELLAPEFVVFLDKDWARIGTRWSLRDVISAVSGIPVNVFEGRFIDEYSIAQRMSWAAFRETTRPEDQAYCLLGIFGVSMSPIYGEGGARAFMRLQQEIIRISDDRSIFAWVAASPMEELKDQWQIQYNSPARIDKPRGLLARSPYEFRMSGDVQASNVELIGNKSSYSFSNNGLHIHLPLNPISSSSGHPGEHIFLAHLLCQSTRGGSYLTVYLRKTSGHQYVRCYADEVFLTSLPPAMDNVRELTVREHLVTGCRVRTSNTSSAAEWSYNIELLQSAWHFLCQSSEEKRCYDTISSIDEHTVSLRRRASSLRLLDLQHTMENPPNIEYKSQKTGEYFTICFTPFGVVIIQTVFVLLPAFRSIRADTCITELESGGYVLITLEKRGDPQENLEIGYLAGGDLEIDLLQGPLRDPDLGITVPSRLSEGSSTYHLKFEGIFPPDPFGRITQDMAYATVFRPHPDDPEECGYPTFRVLTYRRDKLGGIKDIIHVAFGLQGSSVWTDLVIQTTFSDEFETSECVWKSYLDSGSRTEKRLCGKGFAEASFPYDVATGTAVIQRTKNLQLGDYLLHLNMQSGLPGFRI
ncbi:hypothetical protein D9758_006986 [Tetrapyrgos nigripes]|uniref:HET-domain-containing protein n=1 Tax=Tetrapyrgos nigripes TaxID=182062 RepID=A0A8H5LV29_9AGAR|nr:hypothetical protein D9758_006986 [Tetrapyrgos nigripes]